MPASTEKTVSGNGNAAVRSLDIQVARGAFSRLYDHGSVIDSQRHVASPGANREHTAFVDLDG